jgi:DNA segregation ATPase FtsK/SpoIIIE-like protein
MAKTLPATGVAGIIEAMDQQTTGACEKATPDPLYERALTVVRARPERICVANIQRTLAVGYGRATALMDRMVAEGVLDRKATSLGGTAFKLRQE